MVVIGFLFLPFALEQGVTGWLVVHWLLAMPLMVVLVGIHEAAHALVGSAVGMKPFRITIGYGRTIGEFTMRNCRIDFHAIPLGGLTSFAVQHTSWVRLRIWLSIAAGPAANLLLAAPALADAIGSRNSLVNPAHLAYVFAPATLFLTSNLFLFFTAALPMLVRTTAGELRTDGWLLLTVPFYGKDMIADLRASYPTAIAIEHRRAGRHADAMVWFDRALAEAPQSYLVALNRAAGLLGLRRYDEARTEYMALLPRKPLRRFQGFLLLNNIAWADMMLGRPELLDEADKSSKTALDAFPKCAPFQGTRGYVLLRRGRVAEAMALLHQAYVMNSDSRSRAANACCLAIGHAVQGQRDEARSLIVEARSLDPECELLATAEREMAASGEQKGHP